MVWQMSALMDAVRASDNANAMLKRINTDEDHHPHEVEIGNVLTSLGPSPADHCVPMLDTLHPPDDSNISMLVMPLLREYVQFQQHYDGRRTSFRAGIPPPTPRSQI
jgi:hypothetical protein